MTAASGLLRTEVKKAAPTTFSSDELPDVRASGSGRYVALTAREGQTKASKYAIFQLSQDMALDIDRLSAARRLSLIHI